MTSEFFVASSYGLQALTKFVSGSGRLCVNPPAAQRIEAVLFDRSVKSTLNLRSLPSLTCRLLETPQIVCI